LISTQAAFALVLPLGLVAALPRVACDVLRGRLWAPQPSANDRRRARLDAAGRARDAAARAALPAVRVDRVDVEGVDLNFELHHGELNINAIARCLAECEAFGGPRRAGAGAGAAAPRPNRLVVRVVRARRLARAAPPADAADGGAAPPPGRYEGPCAVEVRARGARRKTQSAAAVGGGAMWNETFELQLTDPSAVVRLSVVDEGGGGAPLGAFVVTAKWLAADPLYCDHEPGRLEAAAGGFRGWVRLRDGQLRRRPEDDASAPELEVEVRWVRAPGAFDAAREAAAPGTALEQLAANSEESALRVGDRAACRRMLEDFPLRVDVKRVSIRNVELHVKDLFMGRHGQAEVGAGRRDAVHLPLVDVTEACLRSGDDAGRPDGEPGVGVGLAEFLERFFLKGVTHQLLRHSVVNSLVGQVSSSYLKQLVAGDLLGWSRPDPAAQSPIRAGAAARGDDARGEQARPPSLAERLGSSSARRRQRSTPPRPRSKSLSPATLPPPPRDGGGGDGGGGGDAAPATPAAPPGRRSAARSPPATPGAPRRADAPPPPGGAGPAPASPRAPPRRADGAADGPLKGLLRALGDRYDPGAGLDGLGDVVLSTDDDFLLRDSAIAGELEVARGDFSRGAGDGGARWATAHLEMKGESLFVRPTRAGPRASAAHCRKLELDGVVAIELENAVGPTADRPAPGQEKGAKFPTSKALISVVFHSFWLIFGRAIIPRSALEAWMLFLERARARNTHVEATLNHPFPAQARAPVNARPDEARPPRLSPAPDLLRRPVAPGVARRHRRAPPRERADLLRGRVRSGRGQQNRERGQGRRFFRAAIAAPTHRRASRRTLSDTGPREARRVASLAYLCPPLSQEGESQGLGSSRHSACAPARAH